MRSLIRLSVVVAWAAQLGLGCAHSPSATTRQPLVAASTGTLLQLVESSPTETTLDHPDIPDAFILWPELINGAKRSVDVAQFYVSNNPLSRLEPVLRALEAAAQRGVQVRVLAEEKFYKTYPESLDRLGAQPGITVRRYDVAPLMGGILHAKYFIVDGKTAYLGSQNFDWRSLEHIQELGVEVQDANTVEALADVFETDWQLANGESRDARISRGRRQFPSQVAGVRVTPVFSPKGFLPDESLWDLPKLLQMIDSAKHSVRVQVLTYKASARKGGGWTELDDALVRAGARGVKVELLVSHWATRKGTKGGLERLANNPNVAVKVLTVPTASSGEIPFARVTHAKYMTVDRERAWIGTSNWERDYFYASRNVGVIIEGAAWVKALEGFFESSWNSAYTRPLASR
ncbi:MAG: phospholipase D-like domain-containing protein [Myxococcaceae bacterium]